MTDNGLLAVPDEVASNWLSEPALTAELVFEEVLEDGQDDSDYHNTMTGAKFVAWLRNRLLPTFAELYPGKKMYLVLDNASLSQAARRVVGQQHQGAEQARAGASAPRSRRAGAHHRRGPSSSVPAHLFEAIGERRRSQQGRSHRSGEEVAG